jgi:hypothetical protein
LEHIVRRDGTIVVRTIVYAGIVWDVIVVITPTMIERAVVPYSEIPREGGGVSRIQAEIKALII